ncbi:MAG TPA: hypothetical protein PKA06_14870, partial [Gemmatales bacterium]|nr:hypothetical protein [Gemmatales bacterium]
CPGRSRPLARVSGRTGSLRRRWNGAEYDQATYQNHYIRRPHGCHPTSNYKIHFVHSFAAMQGNCTTLQPAVLLVPVSHNLRRQHLLFLRSYGADTLPAAVQDCKNSQSG